jgi:isoamylase
MAPLPDRLEPGSPSPLGATWDGLGTNFAVFSANAERVDLCLFDPSGKREIARMPLPEHTDEVWHGYLPHAGVGALYGFRAYGPYEPQRGLRFNHNKLLLDPYARRVVGPLRWSDALFGHRVHSPRADLSFDARNSAPAMLKGVVTDDSFNWGDDRPPNVPWHDTVIYEAHLRGLTMLREEIRPHERGTFAALGDPRMIEYLRRLGITAVELLPIHAFVQDRFLLEKGLRNYWGYNTIGYFAVEPTYLAGDSANEMRVAVRRLHAAGIEVILDVVYNHTSEGNELGPMLSFRGLDNTSYYRLQPENPRYYINETGTGNTVNLSHPRVLQMVMDSLRYWVTSFHVDGFRFDLGVTLGRESYGFDPGSGFFDALRQDPTLAHVKLISEPWDIGPGGYQLGHHPPGFAEWNDKFRDGVRRFWRGDAGQRPDFASRLAGSGDLFDRRARRPWASVNYAASHDGYTLADVTAYIERHNEANGEGNRDGHQDNYSANWGVEGPTEDRRIREVRARVARAMLATVFLAHGTPMLLGGDEFGRTQRGNNNAYAQDNEISWLDWAQANSPGGQALAHFVTRLIHLRHHYPVLRCRHFLHGKEEPLPGVRDIEWFDANGNVLTSEAWNNPEERLIVLRRASKDADGMVTILTFSLNPTGNPIVCRIPPPEGPATILIDTAAPEAGDGVVETGKVEVAAHSAVLVLRAVRSPAS